MSWTSRSRRPCRKLPRPRNVSSSKSGLRTTARSRSIILASMTNDIQKQYDRLDDVLSIMLRMKEVYAVLDKHIRYGATKVFFGTKMVEGSSVHNHEIKMLSLVEKLEDLKAGLDNDTYIDVIL
ncbi:UNVERIFIED_CONTAM: hypothetical protein Scaly_0476100 [Sesamum calycinum]|uniref:Uncharacterized protein n=1 Tax=Sesamum calycinum TaxID=2727403 RepID=A0AAW2SF57_9LAMI